MFSVLDLTSDYKVTTQMKKKPLAVLSTATQFNAKGED